MAGSGVQTVSAIDAHEMAGHYERWGREIHTYASRLLGNGDLADDVTQDVFVAALRNGLPRETAAVRPWLYRVATNRCLDVLRRRQRMSWISVAVWREPVGVRDPVGDAVARTDVIRQAIAKLSPRDAALLVLADAQGFGYREVAALLGMSPSATSAALSRAHARLARHYADLAKEESIWPAAPSVSTSGLTSKGNWPQRSACASLTTFRRVRVVVPPSSSTGRPSLRWKCCPRVNPGRTCALP